MIASAKVCVLMACALVAVSGSTFVLPILPVIAADFGVSSFAAQMLVATYSVGLVCGLLTFGFFSPRRTGASLLTLAMLICTVAAITAASAESYWALIFSRFVQGVASAAAPALVPAILRSVYSGARAVRAIATLSSLEAMAPALAPSAAVALLKVGGWRLPLMAVAIAAGCVTLLAAAFLRSEGSAAFYAPNDSANGRLIYNGSYLRLALSHALITSSVLVLVAALPLLLATRFHVGTEYYAGMQLVSTFAFIIATNAAPTVTRKVNEPSVILVGTAVVFAGSVMLVLLSCYGRPSVEVLTACLVVMNIGAGLRGPVSYNCVLEAAQSHEVKGSSMLVLFILVFTSIGVAGTAPLINYSLPLLTSVPATMSGFAFITLLMCPTTNRQ